MELNLNRLRLRSKLWCIILILVMCVFANLIAIHMWISGSRSYRKVINLAGKQRMLTQKMTKEVMFKISGLNVADDFNNTQTLFEKTLNGLIQGDKELELSPAKDEEIISQMRKVKGLWQEFKTELDDAVNNGSASPQIYSLSLDILKEMDKGVEMMEEDAEKAADTLRIISVYSLQHQF